MDLTHRQHLLSTRLAFFAAGVAMSAWAPLVPYAKARAAMDAGQLGLLLLCLGIGSMLAMPVTGTMAARYGCRPAVFFSCLLACLMLPLLAVLSTPLTLALALFVFGAAIGTMDVAMNVQAVIVEKESGRTMMSGFHGLFSVGGIAGAGGMALLLSRGLGPLAASAVLASVAAAAIIVARPFLLSKPAAGEGGGHSFVLPRGAVLLIGVMCFLAFLSEGAVLDWSAVLLATGHGMAEDRAGLGYAVFAAAMTLGRLTGDPVVRRLGGKRVLIAGGLCTALGFITSVVAPSTGIALVGFLLVGIGASNIVPVLFSAAGQQRDMPPGLAVSAISTLGYAGILAGPALIGFAAHALSLSAAFIGLGCAMLMIAASAPRFALGIKPGPVGAGQ